MDMKEVVDLFERATETRAYDTANYFLDKAKVVASYNIAKSVERVAKALERANEIELAKMHPDQREGL